MSQPNIGIRRQTILTFASRVLALFAGLALWALLTRALPPEHVGHFRVGVVSAVLAAIFLNLGLHLSTAYHLASGRLPVRVVTGNSLAFAAGLGALAVGAGALLRISGPPDFLPAGLLDVIPWIIPLYLLAIAGQHVVYGLNRIGTFNFLTTLDAVMAFVGVAGAVAWIGNDVRSALIGALIGMGVSATAAVVAGLSASGGASIDLGWNTLGPQLGYGVRSHLSSLLLVLGTRIDLLVASALLAPADLGFYAAAVALAERVTLVSESTGRVLFPRLAGLPGAAADRLATDTARYVLWIAAGLGAVLVVAAGLVVRLFFTARYEPAVAPLRALIPGMVGLCALRMLESHLAARDRPGLVLVPELVHLGGKVALLFALVPWAGLRGAAWASSASALAAFLVASALHGRLSGISPLRLVLPLLRRPPEGSTPAAPPP